MKHQKIYPLGLLILVSLTLVGCSSSTDDSVLLENTETVVLVDDKKQEPTEVVKEIPRAREEEVEPIVEEKKEVVVASSTLSSSEILYAAKVGDSIEAHPAWLTVTLTLDGDIIQGVSLQQQSSSPKSARHQAQFAQQIEGKVLGKKLSESNDIYISSASSTSWAFNDAVQEIESQLAQS